MKNAKPLIFISHIHEESELATLLQGRLSGMFLGGVRFFVSSDRHSVRGGDDWLSKIRQALSEASVVLSLVGPTSLDRSWINFEAGAGWLQKRVIPLCHSGLKPSQLPQPLQSMFGFDLHDPVDFQDLCRLVGETAGLQSPEADWGALASSVSKVASAIGSGAIRPYGSTQCWVFPSSEDLGTIGSLAQSLARCSKLAIYSIGVNFFWNAAYLGQFETRVMAGECEARICMANFKSDAIQTRFDEEPEHPIGVPGAEHLLRRLLRIEQRRGDSARLSVRVFDHYPTFAMLSFDDDIYVYPYGYKSLGNSSPTFHWRGRDPAAKFFRDQFEAVWDAARHAADVYGRIE